jgi:GrpB-like predicted nucleotidyltransferase (UPF0157 family)
VSPLISRRRQPARLLTGIGGPEIERILVFRDWLRTHDEDRANYERTKRELAQHNWRYLQHYANAKSDIIEEILARALRGRG